MSLETMMGMSLMSLIGLCVISSEWIASSWDFLRNGLKMGVVHGHNNLLVSLPLVLPRSLLTSVGQSFKVCCTSSCATFAHKLVLMRLLLFVSD